MKWFAGTALLVASFALVDVAKASPLPRIEKPKINWDADVEILDQLGDFDEYRPDDCQAPTADPNTPSYDYERTPRPCENCDLPVENPQQVNSDDGCDGSCDGGCDNGDCDNGGCGSDGGCGNEAEFEEIGEEKDYGAECDANNYEDYSTGVYCWEQRLQQCLKCGILRGGSIGQ